MRNSRFSLSISELALRCGFNAIQKRCVRACRLAVLLLWVAFVIAMAPALTRAQTNCNEHLEPSHDWMGQDDWERIDTCLRTTGQAILGPGPFYISQRLRFTLPNSSLIGFGRNATTVIPVFNCSNGPVIDVNGQGGVDVSNGVIRDFKLDLSSMSGVCVEAPPAVRFLRANGGQISGMTIAGSGSAISGGASVTAIVLNRSSNILVSSNEIRDIGGSSSGGVDVENSPSAIVDGNTILRVAAGIVVRNNGGVNAQFDSSNTRVTNNVMRFTTGRTMKLSSPDVGSVPLRNVVVKGNQATDFSLTGLYLTSGVQNATIENNTFIGTSNSWYALWIGSFEASRPNPALSPSFNNNRSYAVGQKVKRGFAR